MVNVNPFTTDKKFCYFIDQSMRDDNGNYTPVIVIEEEQGYYQTDWNLGSDYTCVQDFVNIRNTRLGLSQDEVDAIVINSMRKPLAQDNTFH